MKKFASILTFGLVGASVLFFGFNLWLYSVRYHPNRTHLRLVADEIKNNSEIPSKIIIGDSRTTSINPGWIKKKSDEDFYNFSVGGGDIFYAYYVINRLLEQGIDLQEIYVQISDGNEGNLSTVGTYTQLLVRHFFDLGEVDELEKEIKGTTKYFDSSRFLASRYFQTSNLKAMQKEKLKVFSPKISNKILRNTLKSGKGFFINAKNLEIIVDAKTGEEIYDFSKINSNLSESATRKFEPRPGVANASYIYLDKMISLSKSNDFKLKFFLSPYPQTRKEQFSPDLALGGLTEFLGAIPGEVFATDVAILPNDHFYDWTHPDYKGSVAYTNYFTDIVVNNKTNFEGGDLHSISFPFVSEEDRKFTKLSKINFWDE